MILSELFVSPFMGRPLVFFPFHPFFLLSSFWGGSFYCSFFSLFFLAQFISEEESRQKQEFKTLQENQEIQLKELQDQCNFNITELSQLQVRQHALISLHSFTITPDSILFSLHVLMN